MGEIVIIENPWEQMFERRTISRTRIAKGAKLFFKPVGEPINCGIRDITEIGAGIRADGLTILPIGFELQLDNPSTTRTCHLIWRDGDFMGVKFVA